MAPGMKKLKRASPTGGVSPGSVLSFAKTLYTDEWRFQITKSIALFAIGVYFTRVIAENPEIVAEQA